MQGLGAAHLLLLPPKVVRSRSSRPTRAQALSIERPGRAPWVSARPEFGAAIASLHSRPHDAAQPRPPTPDAAGGGRRAPGGGGEEGQQGASKQRCCVLVSVRREPLRLGLRLSFRVPVRSTASWRGSSHAGPLAPLGAESPAPRPSSGRRPVWLSGLVRPSWGRPLHAGPWPPGPLRSLSLACQPLWTPRWSGL